MNNSLSSEEDKLSAKPYHDSITFVRITSFGKRLIIEVKNTSFLKTGSLIGREGLSVAIYFPYSD
jgi:hypothetical protein